MVIGVIVADTKAAAKEGATIAQQGVEYELLDPILSIEKAIEKESFFQPPFATSPTAYLEGKVLTKGDVEVTLAKAEFTLEGDINVGGQEHFYLETNATFCIPGEDGAMEVQCSHLTPI